MTTKPVMSITDEQIAEIERFVGFGGSFIKVKSSALTALISRLRAAEMDAARYRWLREGCDEKQSMATHIAAHLYGLEWDAAIDTAMKGDQQ